MSVIVVKTHILDVDAKFQVGKEPFFKLFHADNIIGRMFRFYNSFCGAP